MLIEDEMEAQLKSSANIADTKPIPRKRLNRINSTVQSLNDLLDTIKSNEDNAQSLIPAGDQENRYLKQARTVDQEFRGLKDRNVDSADRINEIRKELSKIREILAAQNRTVSGQSQSSIK